MKFLYGPPDVPLTNIVTTTADSGPGSLRAALYYVTDNPGAIVKFNIPTNDPGYSNGVFNIHLTGVLPTLAANGMVIDGSTQPGFAGSPLIFVDGSQIIPETFTSNSGLLIYSSSNQVKNISFSGFNWNGLTLEHGDATNNTISGCWLGLDATGSNAAPNAFQGILFVDGAGHNLVGGTNALARNVISGNAQYGIWMSDSNTTGNTVLGNYIGTDAGGSFAVPNPGGGIGMFSNSVGHIIGGTNALVRNVISGNLGAGVWLAGPGVSNNVVQGNFIGLNATGTAAVPNNFAGIRVEDGATGNLISGNVISGNTSEGLRLIGPGTMANVVQGNFIGTDASGMNSVPNGDIGIDVFGGAASNWIGGTTSAARNVLSGNPEQIRLSDAGTMANVVQGNFIGTDATGLNAFTNESFGLTVYAGASGNLIGGTINGARNVISGNNAEGLRLSDAGTTANAVQGNFIGTDVTGTNALPNGFAGLTIFSGATSNLIGGTGAGARNIISGNNNGLVAANTGTSGNLIQGNYFGLGPDGVTAVPNFTGVLFASAAAGNVFGGTTAGASNTVALNNGTGVVVSDPGTTNNSIRGNSIFSNGYLGIDLVGPNDVYPYVTPNDLGDADIGPNDLQNFPVITNAFGYGTGTVVLGNLNSLASQTFFIDVYRNLTPNFSGYGEGQFYAGSVTVTTDGSGNASFSFTNNAGNYAGQYFTATATSSGGDTSEFSADVLATNVSVAMASFTGQFHWDAGGFNFAVTLQTNFNYRIQAATNLSQTLVSWVDLTNFTATNSPFAFTDRTATNYRVRFYRVVSP